MNHSDWVVLTAVMRPAATTSSEDEIVGKARPLVRLMRHAAAPAGEELEDEDRNHGKRRRLRLRSVTDAALRRGKIRTVAQRTQDKRLDFPAGV